MRTLATRMRQLPGWLAVLEASWDGEADGWFVVLIAVLDDPQHEVDLTCIRQGGADLRVLNGQVPPWPEAQEAMETGTALSEHFSMPFHFASPYWPNEEAPRWRTAL